MPSSALPVEKYFRYVMKEYMAMITHDSESGAYKLTGI